ncbi:MAG: glycosyltransferase family 2 protein [Gammaproteobacteria bacterium]|nr:glycosyltransferase family 2 protein [Gammaproteobacteria bacterium]
MPSLSAVLIVKNEESTLSECLATVDWADEIVIVDAGSTDATIDVAKNHTDKVFVEPDWQGYGVQRQRAQSYATGDWVLMLDADEQITKELQQSIQKVVAVNNQDKVYALPRLSWVFGRFIRHCGWYPDYVIRLYPRNKAAYGDDKVHEKLIFPETMNVEKLKGDLLHFTYRDMEHYLVKSASYAAAWADQRYAKGKRVSLLQGTLHALTCFIRMYIVRLGFLDGRQGLLLSLLSAHSTFVKYADLWVRYRKK